MPEEKLQTLSLQVINGSELESGRAARCLFTQQGNVGHGPECHWSVQDRQQSIPAQAFTVILHDGTFCLRPQTAQLWLNQAKVTATSDLIQLRQGDEIQIGRLMVRVHLNRGDIPHYDEEMATPETIVTNRDMLTDTLLSTEGTPHYPGMTHRHQLADTVVNGFSADPLQALQSESLITTGDPLSGIAAVRPSAPLSDPASNGGINTPFMDLPPIYASPGDRNDDVSAAEMAQRHLAVTPLLRGLGGSLTMSNSDDADDFLEEAGRTLQAAIKGLLDLQQQQRYNDYLDNQRFRAMNDLSWGFTELTLNNELLAQGKIMIDSASGTLPDGTVFSIPDQDALPDPLHPQHFPDERSRNIYLALPVASDVRNEISDGRRIGRYRLNYADVRDLHSEEGDTRTLTLGQLTPHIMSGAEDMSAYITLPLCRISDRHADGSLTLDDDFIPCCQNIQVSKKLRVYLKEVQGAIGGRASDLANRIGSPAQSGIADVAEFMMLQLLNRNQTRFTHRARRSQLHPEDFYLDLAGLLGELMTFTEPSRLPCPLDVYDHHDLTKTFKTLLPEVKRALHTVLSPRAVNLPLHLRDGIWQADIHDTELLQSATFVLAVAANMPVDQIQRQFIQQSKISSPEKIRNMVSVQIPGIPLRALMVAPRQLPYHSGFSYFELDKSGQAWTEMAAAGAVALHVSGSFPDLNMQLWAIRG